MGRKAGEGNGNANAHPGEVEIESPAPGDVCCEAAADGTADDKTNGPAGGQNGEELWGLGRGSVSCEIRHVTITNVSFIIPAQSGHPEDLGYPYPC